LILLRWSVAALCRAQKNHTNIFQNGECRRKVFSTEKVAAVDKNFDHSRFDRIARAEAQR
jgi:hypothetical protein